MSSFASSTMSQIGSSASRSSQAPLNPSSPAGAKRLLGRAAVGAALMVSCLHAGAASALDFNFSFTGIGLPTSPATVTGVVSGLADNASNQNSGLTLTITSATNTPSGGWQSFTDPNYNHGDGFDVSGGLVTGVDIFYINSDQELFLGNQDGYFVGLRAGNIGNIDFNASSSNSLLFTPVGGPPPASVPGPLPLFGAGAAFGWSRRLRRKIKATA
jgi:hypothetical protein